MPSTGVGAGSAAATSAACTTAACAVGQDTPKLSATSATERHASPTAEAIARRNRPVVRARAGSSSIASVNERFTHVRSVQRQRRLCQISEIPLSP
jgi:hypothetical protein